MQRTATSARPRNPTIRHWAAPSIAVSPEECLDQIRSLVESAALSLMTSTPESLSLCEMFIRNASDRLSTLIKTLASSQVEIASLQEKVLKAGDELVRAHQLFQSAAQFHAALLHVVSARRSGYTRSGSPGRLQCSRKLVLRG